MSNITEEQLKAIGKRIVSDWNDGGAYYEEDIGNFAGRSRVDSARERRHGVVELPKPEPLEIETVTCGCGVKHKSYRAMASCLYSRAAYPVDQSNKYAVICFLEDNEADLKHRIRLSDTEDRAQRRATVNCGLYCSMNHEIKLLELPRQS